MKFAPEIINLMSAFPGRDFRMKELVKFVCPAPNDQKERSRVREQVRVVVCALIDAGSVMRRPHRCQGGFASYRWK